MKYENQLSIERCDAHNAKIVKSVAQVFSFNSKIQKRFVPETFTPSLILWIIKSKKHLLIEIADRSIL